MLVYIDLPKRATIKEPVTQIAGWCASAEEPALDDVALRIGDSVLPVVRVARPDVTAAHPRKATLGFSCLIDLSRHVGALRRHGFTIELLNHGQAAKAIGFRLAPGVAEAAARRAEKRRWCLERLRCPVCTASPRLAPGGDIVCDSCQTRFSQQTRALNLLSPELAARSGVHPTDNVSSHPYDEIARQIIAAVQLRGGMVLDCGAGLRGGHEAAVINLEIVDYPTTDIVAVGESLPFVDGIFDAVFSLSVLEHVIDPFACADELVRVLKPGGTLYCVTPFLQPEHGYPNHFYNMTRQGVRNLFQDKLTVEKHNVPAAGLPIWSLHWFLSQYLEHLTEPLKAKFKRMTVADFLAKTPLEFLSEDIVRGLDQEGRWILACTNALILRKPGAEPDGLASLAVSAAEATEIPVETAPAPRKPAGIWARWTRRKR